MQTVTLTERRPAVVRVPRAAAVALRRDYPAAFDVQPAWRPGIVRVTPRGVVGAVTAGGVRWVVRPKLPAGALAALLGPSYTQADAGGEADADDLPPLADLLADRLSSLLAARPAGLRRGYAEGRSVDPAVRGRIDFPQLMREPRAFGPVPVVADEFTADVPRNRAAAAAARHLLAGPLSPPARHRLTLAAAGTAGVTPRAPTPAEWAQLATDPRLAADRELLAWCRVVLTGSAAGGAGFLVSLEPLFQDYVTRGLGTPGRLPAGWGVASPTLALPASGAGPPVVLRPDVLVTGPDGAPRAVWDAKWKTLGPGGPNPADVHQALAYAQAFGVPVCGLVYPGKRFGHSRYDLPSKAGTFRVVRLNLAAGPSGAGGGLGWLARRCRGRVSGV